jgi:hypothetical protein
LKVVEGFSQPVAVSQLDWQQVQPRGLIQAPGESVFQVGVVASLFSQSDTLLPLTLDLGHQVPHVIAVEFGDQGNAVNVSDLDCSYAITDCGNILNPVVWIILQ